MWDWIVQAKPIASRITQGELTGLSMTLGPASTGVVAAGGFAEWPTATEPPRPRFAVLPPLGGARCVLLPRGQFRAKCPICPHFMIVSTGLSHSSGVGLRTWWQDPPPGWPLPRPAPRPAPLPTPRPIEVVAGWAPPRPKLLEEEEEAAVALLLLLLPLEDI